MEEIKNIFDENKNIESIESVESSKSIETLETPKTTENSNSNKINEVVLIARPYDKEMLEISKKLIDKYLELGFIKSAKEVDELISQISQNINELISQISHNINDLNNTSNNNKIKITEITEELKKLDIFSNHIKNLITSDLEIKQNIENLQKLQSIIKEKLDNNINEVNNNLANYLKLEDFNNEKDIFNQNFFNFKIKLENFKTNLDKINESLTSISEDFKIHKDNFNITNFNLNNLKDKIDKLEVKEFIINNKIDKLETKFLDIIEFFNKTNNFEVENIKEDINLINSLLNTLNIKLDTKADFSYIEKLKESLNTKIDKTNLDISLTNKEVENIKEKLNLKADNLDLELIKSEIIALKEHDNLQDTQIQDIKLEPIIENLKNLNENIILKEDKTNVYNKTEIDLKLSNLVTKDQIVETPNTNTQGAFYSKQAIDELLSDKVNVSDLDAYLPNFHEFYRKEQVDNLLLSKIDLTSLENYYPKSYIDSVFDFSKYYDKNDLDNKLLIINNKIDSVEKPDLSNYYTIPEIDTKLDNINLTNYYNKTEIDTKLDNINLTNYYNKTEIDTKLDNIQIDKTDIYTKTEVYNKTEVDNKLDNINLTNYYNKTEVDNKFLNIPSFDDIVKFDLTNYYNKTEVDSKLNNIPKPEVVDLTKFYTKPETDLRLSLKVDKTYTYSKSEIHNLINQITPGVLPEVPVELPSSPEIIIPEVDLSNYYNKTETEIFIKNYLIDFKPENIDLSNYYNKTDLDFLFNKYYNKTEVYNKTQTYNINELYNKTEINEILKNYKTNLDIDLDFEKYYSKDEIDTILLDYKVPEIDENLLLQKLDTQIQNIVIDKEGLVNKVDFRNFKTYFMSNVYDKSQIDLKLQNYSTKEDLLNLNTKYITKEYINGLIFDFVKFEDLNSLDTKFVKQENIRNLATFNYVDNEIRKVKTLIDNNLNNPDSSESLLPNEEKPTINVDSEYMEANLFTYVTLTKKLIDKGVINANS